MTTTTTSRIRWSEMTSDETTAFGIQSLDKDTALVRSLFALKFKLKSTIHTHSAIPEHSWWWIGRNLNRRMRASPYVCDAEKTAKVLNTHLWLSDQIFHALTNYQNDITLCKFMCLPFECHVFVRSHATWQCRHSHTNACSIHSPHTSCVELHYLFLSDRSEYFMWDKHYTTDYDNEKSGRSGAVPEEEREKKCERNMFLLAARSDDFASDYLWIKFHSALSFSARELGTLDRWVVVKGVGLWMTLEAQCHWSNCQASEIHHNLSLFLCDLRLFRLSDASFSFSNFTWQILCAQD